MNRKRTLEKALELADPLAMFCGFGIIFNLYCMDLNRRIYLADVRRLPNADQMELAMCIRDNDIGNKLKIIIPYYFVLSDRYEGIPK